MQAYSYGGTTNVGHDADKVETMSKVADRVLKIRFNADIGASMRWNFRPQQYEIKVSLNIGAILKIYIFVNAIC